MSYDFKKIKDLDFVEEVPEGANVLIEIEGSTKRLPSTAIKASVAPPDMSQNDPTAPDYVKNRTHYTETSIINKTVMLEPTGESSVQPIYDIELANAICNNPSSASLYIYSVSVTCSLGEVIEENGSEITYAIDDGEFVVDGTTGYIYLNSGLLHGGPAELSAPVMAETVHKLDKKYLPDDVGGGVTVFYVAYDYLCHDKEMTVKVSKDEYRLALSSGVVTIATPDGYSVYYPSYTDFGYDYAKVSLWDDGGWWTVYTSEYTAAPPV